MEQKDEPIKFHRPPNNDEFKQSKVEKDMMAYKVLFGYPNNVVYALFNHHLCEGEGTLNKTGQRECRMFFTHPNNVAYMDALRAHLSAMIDGLKFVNSADEFDDARKDKALKKLLTDVLKLVEDNEKLDPETLKNVVEVVKRLGILKDDGEEQEAPRRYLPERCGACLYRSFVESHVESGEIENACLRCKALKLAQDNGFRYDPKNLLEQPTIKQQ